MRERPMSNKLNNVQIAGATDRDNVDLLRTRRPIADVIRYPPPRTTMCASFLFLGGITLFIAGMVIYFNPKQGRDSGLPIFVLGLISKYI